MRLILTLLAMISLSGCLDTVARSTVDELQKKLEALKGENSKLIEEKTSAAMKAEKVSNDIEAKKADLAKLQGELAAMESHEKELKEQAKKEAREARINAIQKTMFWFAVITFIAGAICVGAAILVKLFYKTFLTAAAACGGVGLTALFVDFSLDYMIYLFWTVGGILAVGFIVFGIFLVRKLIIALRLSSAHGDAMEAAETTEDVLKAKAVTVADQVKHGVQGLTCKAAGKVPKSAKDILAKLGK